jgi:hypothetical protein
MKSRVCLLLMACASLVNAQTSVRSGDPQALAIASKSMAALTGGAPISDVTLTGSVTSTAGSVTKVGTLTMMAGGTTSSRVESDLDAGKTTEMRNASTGSPQGVWAINDGPSKTLMQHNEWTDTSWFFPALTSLGDANAVLAYVGQEQHGDSSVFHLRSYRRNSSAVGQQLSQMDFYVDSSTYLPVAAEFSIHPDDNMSLNIPVEIVYSDYQQSNGLLVPMHVQRFIQGTLALDITVSSVSVNTGLPAAEFTVQ